MTTSSSNNNPSMDQQQHAIKPQSTSIPQQTLYVRNLNEKINKEKLKRELYACFCKSGRIIDIILSKKKQARGQAWIIFEDIESATKAKVAFQGFQFFGKSFDIHYANTPSTVVTGTSTNKTTTTTTTADKSRKRGLVVEDQPNDDDNTAAAATTSDAKRVKTTTTTSSSSSIPPPPTTTTIATAAATLIANSSNNPPSNIIMVDASHALLNKTSLQEVFDKFAGFEEVRYIPSKGIAFIEFKTTTQATLALSATRGLEKNGTKIRAAFAKA
jgi:U1 small nuclear ribonucleoprotein A